MFASGNWHSSVCMKLFIYANSDCWLDRWRSREHISLVSQSLKHRQKLVLSFVWCQLFKANSKYDKFYPYHGVHSIDPFFNHLILSAWSYCISLFASHLKCRIKSAMSPELCQVSLFWGSNWYMTSYTHLTIKHWCLQLLYFEQEENGGLGLALQVLLFGSPFGKRCSIW